MSVTNCYTKKNSYHKQRKSFYCGWCKGRYIIKVSLSHLLRNNFRNVYSPNLYIFISFTSLVFFYQHFFLYLKIMTISSGRIFIVGGTGNVGRKIVHSLLSKNIEVLLYLYVKQKKKKNCFLTMNSYKSFKAFMKVLAQTIKV